MSPRMKNRSLLTLVMVALCCVGWVSQPSGSLATVAKPQSAPKPPAKPTPPTKPTPPAKPKVKPPAAKPPTSKPAFGDVNRRVFGLNFKAANCPPCLSLQLILDKLSLVKEFKDVVWVHLDMTNEASKKDANMAGEKLHMQSVIKKYMGKTGIVVLVDGVSFKEVGTFTAKEDMAAIQAKIKKALGGK